MALLESGAAVLKSTIYSEYYSDQIQRRSTCACKVVREEDLIQSSVSSAWYHFIPVSMMYTEIYNIYSYFLGQPGRPKPIIEDPSEAPKKRKQKRSAPLAPADIEYEQHASISAPLNQGANEDELEQIGIRGQDWQTKFGKTKDMEIYCYRLAIEWGRLWQRDGFTGTF